MADLAPLKNLWSLSLNKYGSDECDRLRVGEIIMGGPAIRHPSRLYTQELSLRFMPQFASLEHLYASNAVLDAPSFDALSSQRQLRLVDLDGTNVRDEWLRPLASLELETLSLSDTAISNDALAVISTIETLEHLDIGRVPVTSDDLNRLVTLRQLRALHLDRVPHGSQLIDAICSLRQLEYLTITNSGLVDEDIVRLKKHPRLKTVDLSGNPVSSPGMHNLRTRAGELQL